MHITCIRYAQILFILHLLHRSTTMRIVRPNDIIIIDDSSAEYETTIDASEFADSVNTREIDLESIGIAIRDPYSGSKSEGDIAIGNIRAFVEESNRRKPNEFARNAIRQQYRRWPNGVIPYALSSKYGSYSRSIIAKAMNEYHRQTCIRFIPRDTMQHRDYVYIYPDDGCYSLVGRTGGRQPVSLDAGCIQTGTIVHELMHAVGFFHEQSRADRDQFIDIVWANVIQGADDQFEKYSLNVIDHLNEPYDYNSIMHYGSYAFSDNGRKTILAKRGGAERMGQRVAMTVTDLAKINKLYSCSTTATPPIVDAIDNSVVAQPEQRDCRDQNWRCSFWSMGIFGYCDKHAEIRTHICRKSCGSCGRSTRSIDDDDARTINTALSGHRSDTANIHQ